MFLNLLTALCCIPISVVVNLLIAGCLLIFAISLYRSKIRTIPFDKPTAGILTVRGNPKEVILGRKRVFVMDLWPWLENLFLLPMQAITLQLHKEKAIKVDTLDNVTSAIDVTCVFKPIVEDDKEDDVKPGEEPKKATDHILKFFDYGHGDGIGKVLSPMLEEVFREVAINIKDCIKLRKQPKDPKSKDIFLSELLQKIAEKGDAYISNPDQSKLPIKLKKFGVILTVLTIGEIRVEDREVEEDINSAAGEKYQRTAEIKDAGTKARLLKIFKDAGVNTDKAFKEIMDVEKRKIISRAKGGVNQDFVTFEGQGRQKNSKKNR